MIERIKEWDRWMSKPRSGPGQTFDPNSYRGCINAFFFLISITVALWNFDEAYSFLSNFLGEPFEINRAKQSWHQICALAIGLPGIFWSVFAFIMVPIKRRRAIESAKGQWFDQDGQTRSDALSRKDEGEGGREVDTASADAGSKRHANRPHRGRRHQHQPGLEQQPKQ